jgi:protein arginine kinase activator
MKCENCNNPATVHLTEIKAGKKIEKHLCESCAAALEGIGNAKGHTPINELLTNFVMAQSGTASKEQTHTCETCGVTWAEFRQTGVLGCANDYRVFERELAPLIQRAHESATHHIGKSPTRRGSTNLAPKRRVDTDKLKKDLQRAIEAEDYERAAKIRDQIRAAENA